MRSRAITLRENITGGNLLLLGSESTRQHHHHESAPGLAGLKDLGGNDPINPWTNLGVPVLRGDRVFHDCVPRSAR